MIALVWVISAVISIPPLVGWNDWPDEFNDETPCKLTEDKGYVIYSSSGSFFIPLIIMTVVYIKIFQATKRRLRDRAKASAMANLASSSKSGGVKALPSGHKPEIDSASDELKQDKESDEMLKKEAKNDESATEPINDILTLSPKNTKEVAHYQDSTSHSNDQTSAATVIVNVQENSKSEVVAIESATRRVEKAKKNVYKESSSGSLKVKAKGKETATGEGMSSVKRFWEEKQKISLSRERRATRILGIVMGMSWCLRTLL